MSKKLIIAKREKQKLNKQQQSFNRLVRKLERLRKELAQTSKILGKKLDFYGTHIHPLEQTLIALRQEGVKLLYKFYTDKDLLSVKDKEVLREIMSSQLNAAFELSREKPDEEIQEIFEVVEGISYEKVVAEDFAAMKDDLAETFQTMGLDVDLDGFEKDMSEEEMMRKMAEMFGQLKDNAEAKAAAPKKRKKTPKQLAKEERERQIEGAKSKNVASIYKQLARVFHPDLEQDPTLKLQKEDLMKQLTVAYEKGDLHTLLRLELEWIEKEEESLDQLSDDKLSIYNQVLKQQVEELEAEVLMTMQHPRYLPLQRFSIFALDLAHINLESEKRSLEMMIKDLEQSLARLKGRAALKELKTIIRMFKQPRPKSNLFEIDLEEFFG